MGLPEGSSERVCQVLQRHKFGRSRRGVDVRVEDFCEFQDRRARVLYVMWHDTQEVALSFQQNSQPMNDEQVVLSGNVHCAVLAVSQIDFAVSVVRTWRQVLVFSRAGHHSERGNDADAGGAVCIFLGSHDLESGTEALVEVVLGPTYKRHLCLLHEVLPELPRHAFFELVLDKIDIDAPLLRYLDKEACHRQGGVQQRLIEAVAKHRPLAQRAACLLIDRHAQSAAVHQVHGEAGPVASAERLQHLLARELAILPEPLRLRHELFDRLQCGHAQALGESGVVHLQLLDAELHLGGRALQARERQAPHVERDVHLIGHAVLNGLPSHGKDVVRVLHHSPHALEQRRGQAEH